MAVALKTEHLKRYRDLLRLFMKYGRSDLVKNAAIDELPDDQDLAAADGDPLPEQLAADLEKLGPTFIKLGQLLSTRPDLLPIPYMEALARLQDNVGPFPFEEVSEIVTTELGVRLSKAFSEFDPIPVAAASLGQVHRAALRSGRPVAVKVQRPGIRERMVDDMEALQKLAEFLDRHTEAGKRFAFADMLEEFRKTLLRELDYRQEAKNLSTLAENLKGFDRIVIPQPVDDYTTSKVLTFDYVRGQKITSISPLARTEMDGSVLAEQLFHAYLQQILVDGFVHADPHPGNVFLTEDDRIALLDLGMVARITPAMQEKLLQLLLAVSEGRSDEAASIAIKIGKHLSWFDEPMLRRRVADIVARNQDQKVEDIQVGRVVMMLTKVSGDCGIRVPPELAMLGKTLLNLDQVGQALDPKFDPNASVRNYAAQLTQARVRKSLSPGNLLETVLETREFLQKLPTRVNRILDLVAENNVQVKVDAIDEKMLMEGFQKIANRITVGLILAALIVGAALLMRVETRFQILGYPGLAILCFLGAAAGAVWLLLNILIFDERRARKDV